MSLPSPPIPLSSHSSILPLEFESSSTLNHPPQHPHDNHVPSWGYKFDTDVILLALAFDPTNSHFVLWDTRAS